MSDNNTNAVGGASAAVIPEDRQLAQRKAPRKEYVLLKPVRIGKEVVEPADDGKPPVMVSLRDDQAAIFSKTGHIKN